MHTISISWQASGFSIYYGKELADHFGGTGTVLTFGFKGRTMIVGPSSTDACVPTVREPNHKMKSYVTKWADVSKITGLPMGKTDLRCVMLDGGRVAFEVPSNLKVKGALEGVGLDKIDDASDPTDVVGEMRRLLAVCSSQGIEVAIDGNKLKAQRLTIEEL